MFRIVPDSCDGNGYPLLGARTVGPEGLDIQTNMQHHVVRKLGLTCIRAELEQSANPVEEHASMEMMRVMDELYIQPGEERVVRVARILPSSRASVCSRAEEDAVEGEEQESVWDSRPTEGSGWLMPVGKAIVVPGLCARAEESGDADEVLARAPESEAVLLEAGDPLAVVDFCPSAETELLP